METKKEAMFLFKPEKSFQVKGVAIKPGVSRNGIHYTADELKKFAKSMTTVPILMDHQNETLNSIGVVEKGRWSNKGQEVLYEGWIKQNQVKERIEDGRITHVSIGAIIKQLVEEDSDDKDDDNTIMLAKGMTWVELSTTPVPGVPDASITSGEKFTDVIAESITINDCIIKNKKLQEYFDEKAFDEYVKIENGKFDEDVEEKIEVIKDLKKSKTEKKEIKKEEKKEEIVEKEIKIEKKRIINIIIK